MNNFKDILKSVLDEQSGAGAPTIPDKDKENKGTVDDKSDDSVAGTKVIDEVSDQEKENKGKIVTGTKGGEFA